MVSCPFIKSAGLLSILFGQSAIAQALGKASLWGHGHSADTEMHQSVLTRASQASMIDLFGRMPVHERQWIQHVIAIPGANSAYMGSAIIVFRGSVGTPSVFQHETGHALDFYKNSFQTSARWEWLDAIRQDTCVPDNYANTSECCGKFAQIGVVSLFAIANPGGLDPAFGQTWHCLLSQFTIYNGFQSDSMSPGGVCTRRWADSAIISTKAAKTTPGAAPKPGNVLGMPGVFAIPFEVRTNDTVFGNLVVNKTESAAAAVRQDAWAEEANVARKAKRAQRAKL